MPVVNPDPVWPGAIVLADLSAMARLAEALATRCEPGDVIALDGPLGAGKTTLVRAAVAALGGEAEQVQSPTFTLLHQYHAQVPVVHVDAYRLNGPASLAGLGFEELAEDSIAFVEWAERVLPALPADRLWRIVLAHGDGHRSAVVAPPPGRAWAFHAEST